MRIMLIDIYEVILLIIPVILLGIINASLVGPVYLLENIIITVDAGRKLA